MEQLIAALQILMKYDAPTFLAERDGDAFYIVVEPSLVSEKDKMELDRLGFFINEKGKYCASFHCVSMKGAIMGQIKVTVQTEDRLRVIESLANSISALAAALNVQPQVYITNCVFEAGPGVVIDTAEEVRETKIVEVETSEED